MIIRRNPLKKSLPFPVSFEYVAVALEEKQFLIVETAKEKCLLIVIEGNTYVVPCERKGEEIRLKDLIFSPYYHQLYFQLLKYDDLCNAGRNADTLKWSRLPRTASSRQKQFPDKAR